MSWKFFPMSPGELNIDPIEREFFASETLQGITDPLVREAIQNSLDAALSGHEGMTERAGESDRGTGRVRVRFQLGVAADDARERFLDGLLPHVRVTRDPTARAPEPGEPLRYLVIEDHGTRGLEGDPEQFEDLDPAPEPGGSQPPEGAQNGEQGTPVRTAAGRNDFYYFWRNVGRSRKSDTDRGRWGLGKTVFAAASRLDSFFGLTRRSTDGSELLMGQSVLKIHRLEGQRYRPYGYFGTHRHGLSLPLDDRATVQAFAETFGLRRREGPGLSIVVPYPDAEIDREHLLDSVLRHYFHPLLTERLEVTVGDDSGPSVTLRGQDLEREVARRDELRDLLPLIQLARWGMDPEPEAEASLASPEPGRAPKLSDDLFAPGDLSRLRRRFDEGRRIALEVALPIERPQEEPRPTMFHLLMERDPQDRRGEGHFVRQGITVENPTARRPRGVRWILVAADPALSAFLGDAENPAHTEWQRSSPKFKEKYVRGPSTLDFVRAAPANVAALLSRPAAGREPNLLREIFSVPTDGGVVSPQLPEPTTIGVEQETVEDVVPEGLGGNGALVLRKVRTGFRLRGSLSADDHRGALPRLEILAAYDVLRGNPFARYSPLDFRFDEHIAVTPEGVQVLDRSENRLEVEVERPDFDVLVTRFDEHRDLRVRVRELEPEAELEPGP